MALLFAAAFAAYWIKGMCGFANTLIFTSILSFGMNNVNITPMELIIAIPSNIIMAWQERRHMNWRLGLSVAAMVILGDIPGVLLLKNAGAQEVKLILGALIIFTGLHMFYKEQHPSRKPQRPAATMALNFFSGIFCGLYGIGALMAANITRITRDTHEARGVMSIVFLSDGLFRIIVYSLTGIMTLQVVKDALVALPFALLGLIVGGLCIRRVNERTARFIIIFALIVSGAALILTNL